MIKPQPLLILRPILHHGVCRDIATREMLFYKR
ncbi:MAG: hypothetical protein ACI89U_001636, partial [Gammaproteobacteria bacterium]